MNNIGNQRHKFDIPDDVSYLDCATMSPLLLSSYEATRVGLQFKLHPWLVKSEDFFNEAEQVREIVGRLINTQSDNIALIPGASYGVALAAANIPIQSGQEVLILESQHTANAYSWMHYSKQVGAKIRVLKRPNQLNWTEIVLEAIGAKTAVAALPCVHSSDGSELDLTRISIRLREFGAALVLDATHSIGATNIDINSVQPDFLVAAGYKWLLGPYGTGIMYVAPKWQQGRPLEEPGLNRLGSSNFVENLSYLENYIDGARRYDVSSRGNFGLIQGLRNSLQQIESWGIHSIAKELTSITTAIADKVKQIDLPGMVGAVAHGHYLSIEFLEQLPIDLIHQLERDKVYVSARGRWLRLTPYLHNSERDVESLFKAITACGK